MQSRAKDVTAYLEEVPAEDWRAFVLTYWRGGS